MKIENYIVQVWWVGAMFTFYLHLPDTNIQYFCLMNTILPCCLSLDEVPSRRVRCLLACLCIWMYTYALVCARSLCVPNSSVWRTPSNYCLPVLSPQETHLLGNIASAVDCVCVCVCACACISVCVRDEWLLRRPVLSPSASLIPAIIMSFRLHIPPPSSPGGYLTAFTSQFCPYGYL